MSESPGSAQRFPVSGLIMAGGRSRRLGVDKTTMLWPPPAPGQVSDPKATTRTLLEATGAKLEQLCAEVLAVAYRGQRPIPYPIAPDLFDEGGSLGGIYSGLFAASHDYALAVATDMPFLSLPLVRWMLEQPHDYDVLVPVRDEPEPLHAVYSKRCLEPMRHRLEAHQLKITGFFSDVRVRYVDSAVLTQFDPHGHSFFNINTPEDLERARQILTRGQT